MKQSRIDLIRRIYLYDEEFGDELTISLHDDDEQPSGFIESVSDLTRDVEWLERNDYVTQPHAVCGAYILALTEKGNAFAQNGFSENNDAQNGFTFNMNNASISGSQIGNNTIENLTISFDSNIAELEKAILNKPMEDQETLKELLTTLKCAEKSGEPVKRGILARFSDVIKKHTDLIAPIGAALISLLS